MNQESVDCITTDREDKGRSRVNDDVPGDGDVDNARPALRLSLPG